MPGSWHDSYANYKQTFIHPPHLLHVASLFSPPGKAILTCPIKLLQQIRALLNNKIKSPIPSSSKRLCRCESKKSLFRCWFRARVWAAFVTLSSFLSSWRTLVVSNCSLVQLLFQSTRYNAHPQLNWTLLETFPLGYLRGSLCPQKLSVALAQPQIFLF